MEEDQKKRMNAILLEDNRKNEEHFKKNQEILDRNNKFIYEARKAYDRLEKLYKEMGFEYSGSNPMFVFNDVFPVRELAKITYTEEIKKMEELGFKPAQGWHEFGTTSTARANKIKSFFKQHIVMTDAFMKPEKIVKRVKL